MDTRIDFSSLYAGTSRVIGGARRLIAEGFPQEQVGKGESNSAAHGDSEALLRFLQSLKRLGVR